MPILKDSSKLRATYNAALHLIASRTIPSALLEANRRLYRIIDPTKAHSMLTKPPAGGSISKVEGFDLMVPSDGASIDRDRNRFSGLSGDVRIPPAAGLYTSLQQQALMNERMYYSDWLPPEPSALQIEYTCGRSALKQNGPLAGQCILQFRVLGSMLVADLSPHNPGARAFFNTIGAKVWEEVQDSTDCSVSRGIGLAVAHSGYLSGLIARTVRASDQVGKCGDNVVLYAIPGRPVQGLALEKATFFDLEDRFESFPSAFNKKC